MGSPVEPNTHEQPWLNVEPPLHRCECVVGTSIIDGEQAFVFEPCGGRCPNARQVFKMMREAGKPVKVVDLR